MFEYDKRLDRLSLIRLYFFFTYLAVLVNGYSFFANIELSGVVMTLFSITAFLVYCLIYLIPSYALTRLVTLISGLYLRNHPSERARTWGLRLIYGTAIASTSILQCLIFADKPLFSLFRMHFNGFVWNLIKTPGGITSMGSDSSSDLTYALIISGFILFQVLLFVTVLKWKRLHENWKSFFTPKRSIAVVLLVLMAMLGERMTFAVSHLKSYEPVLYAAQSIPFYNRTTIRHWAKSMGIDTTRTEFQMKSSSVALQYPLNPLVVDPPEKPLNVMWLVSESWRWDMLDPEIMPNTWAFSEQAHRFENHYSGGNGTRMGLFSMFFGIYGSYWFSFLEARRGPLLMDVMLDQGYTMDASTSANFSYPEFDKTLFTHLAPENLHESVLGGEGWERDRELIGNLLERLDERDQSKPFMGFMFFESPHARYYFPESSAIRTPYLETFNYATMDLENDIDLIKNRYINSCHHLDTQIKRVLVYLTANDLMDNTIIILTGDHGEEFMEKGLWGHNSEFHEEQIRVPLVLWIPGEGTSIVQKMTSHLDMASTIGPLLGITNPVEDYTLGRHLLTGEEREFTVTSDWNRLGFIGKNYKATYPVSNVALMTQITDAHDTPLKDTTPFYDEHKEDLMGVLQDLSKYRK